MSLRFRICAGIRLAVAVIVLVILRHGAAADDTIKLRAVPDQLSLQPGAAKQTVLLVAQVTLPAETTVKDAVLHWLASPELTVKHTPAYTETKDGDRAWTVEIESTERAAKEAVLVLWLGVTILYVALWLAFGMLLSVVVRRAATSALRNDPADIPIT